MTKQLIIALLTLLPATLSAQDNTWERIEVSPEEKANPDAKYLAIDAVPMKDGKVCWQTTIAAPGKTAGQIYDILLAQLEKMTTEPNQIKNSDVALKDSAAHRLVGVFHEWLVFKSTALSLDRTQLNFLVKADCSDGQADVTITRITYDYQSGQKEEHLTAEEWISDKACVNKKRTKLYPISGKFRRKTIDRKDYIFNKFNTLLNGNK